MTAREPLVQEPVAGFHGWMSPIDFDTLQANPTFMDAAPSPPPWAKVAPEQIAEAKKHGVPVAFENDLGMRFVLIPAGTFLIGSPELAEGFPVARRPGPFERRVPQDGSRTAQGRCQHDHESQDTYSAEYRGGGDLPESEAAAFHVVCHQSSAVGRFSYPLVTSSLPVTGS